MNPKLNIIIFTLLFCYSCKDEIYSDFDYIPKEVISKTFILGDECQHAHQYVIDSLTVELMKKKTNQFIFDIYPFQFGPRYDSLGKESTPNNQCWELGPLFSIKTLKQLSLYSVCGYNLNIIKNNDSLEYLEIQSHSCDFAKSVNPTKFSKLSNIKHLKFSRINLTSDDLNEISMLRNLTSFEAKDCLLDLEYLLPLKNQLKYIDLTNSNVNNLNLISKFKKLEVIYIGGTGESNINWFLNIEKLKGLSIKRNEIINANSLSEIKNLQKLFISMRDTSKIPFDLKNQNNIEIIRTN